MYRIAITGSQGLIGRHLRAALAQRNIETVDIDIALPAQSRGRVDLAADSVSSILQPLFADCAGVVHLGAVSRVVWGERDPERCVRTNVDGTRAVLDAATRCETPPWVLLASSREVYGNADPLPASEDSPLQPMNVYARSKVAAESAVLGARAQLRTAVARLSSVYGDTDDHVDRVVPAFCRAAVQQGTFRIEGAKHMLDLTYAVDVVEGLCLMIDRLVAGESALPIIHFVSGQGTTLEDLAELVRSITSSRAKIEHAPPRTYDVSKFVGNPSRAREVLGWQTTTPLATGLTRLCQAYVALGLGQAAQSPQP